MLPLTHTACTMEAVYLVPVEHLCGRLFLQEPINAVFDKAVFGNKVVMADILEADHSGNLPTSKPFTHKGGSAISNLMKQPKLVSI